MYFRRLVVPVLIAAFLAPPSSAAVCVNRFLNRSEGARHVMTLLTGKVTFQEAQLLAPAAVEWVDDKGNKVAGAAEIKVVRPMPVGCDGKTSGVVMLATFLTAREPGKVIFVKIGGGAPVEFTQQD